MGWWALYRTCIYLSLTRWGKRAAHNRAQIVYFIAENLELRHKEVAQRIVDMTGGWGHLIVT